MLIGTAIETRKCRIERTGLFIDSAGTVGIIGDLYRCLMHYETYIIQIYPN